jgi:type II secretory pathway pseudopilin PulG
MTAHTPPRRRQGLSLIELTVVLAVAVTIALILTPSISSLLADSRVERARSDCGLIAEALARFYNDNGTLPIWKQVQTAQRPGILVDVLLTAGTPLAIQPGSRWTTGNADTLARQLIWNAPKYPRPTLALKLGWAGPYLSVIPGPDPWGHPYLVNVGAVAADAAPNRVPNAMWVLSPGPNGRVDTTFVQPAARASLGGDDIGMRIQ